ncbi:MAG: serine/threonine-protein kinase [Aureliella sp.]
MSMRQKKLPIASLERIDDLCAEFERQWQSEEPQSIESILDQVSDELEREVLLSELIALEVDYRTRRGDAPAKQDYLDRFPEDASVIKAALGEREQSQKPFEPPTIEALSELFPSLKVEALIGAGGMGAVYKARQQGLDRVVALKVLPEEFSRDVKFAMRFTREARTLAKLNHPNIVSVFEFGSVGDTYYFLMEYVEGSTLRDAVRLQTLAPEHALEIVPRLCDALQYAHDQGVIHRDIKPENILMSVDGAVKIADFGLSRILGDDGNAMTLTRTHQVMGTPRYMAPEQMEGARSVDHRADIYSLGVVFYEMLTGELPIGRFAAPSRKVEIDVRLDEVVLRTLEKEPQLRYQAASHIKTDLQSIASGEPVLLEPTIVTDSRAAEGVDRSSAIGRSPAPTPGSSAASAISELQEKELSARLLLSRRELLNRVQKSLRPLFRWQLFQMAIAIGIILLGVQCWAPNTHIPHRLVSGIILHVYGIILIGCAAAVCTRINRIDYSRPVTEIRSRLDDVRRVYLGVGSMVGFPWWLMWIPATVAIGFDAVLLPASLWVSLGVGVVGLAISLWLYLRLLWSEAESARKWQRGFEGESISNAFIALGEIEAANIQ